MTDPATIRPPQDVGFNRPRLTVTDNSQLPELTQRERIRILLRWWRLVRPDVATWRDESYGEVGVAGTPHPTRQAYRQGSFDEVERWLALMRERAPKVYWHTCEAFVFGRPENARNRKAELGVEFLHARMRRPISVPREILEAEGYVKPKDKPREAVAA